MVKNGNFTLLVTSRGQKNSFILHVISSGQEWQFHMANGPSSESRLDGLNTATPNLAKKPTLGNGPNGY